MNELITRYVDVALHHVPDPERGDVGREIRTAIDEIVEQRVAAGEPEAEAVRSALTELGDPQHFASSYHEQTRHLIGPNWYPAYIEVLKRVLPFALPIAAIVALVDALGPNGAGLASALGQAVQAVVWVTGATLFWITAGFAIAERFGPAPVQRHSATWTIDQLPPAPRARQIGLGDTLPGAIGWLIFGAFILVLEVESVGRFARDLTGLADGRSVINPAIGDGWLIGFFALLAFSILVELAKYTRGYWTRSVLALEVVAALCWLAYAIGLALSGPIIDPEVVDQVGKDGDWWRADDTINTIIVLLIIPGTWQAVWDAWKGHRTYRRRHASAGS